MQIVVTKAGKVIVVLIGVGVLFLIGATIIIPKIVENHYVNSIDSVPEKFDESHLSYNSYKTLKSSFSDLHTRISKEIEILNKLKEKYPNNVKLKKKKKNHNKYLESMNNAYFDCPNHINKEVRYESCPKCKGTGKTKSDKECKECKGKGNIEHTKKQACPYCKTIDESKIPAKSLLSELKR